MTTVISVEHLSKSYRLGQIGTGTFAHDLSVWWARMRGKPNPMLRIGESERLPSPPSPLPLGEGSRGEVEEIWALRDVSFTVEQGEVLGIIGRNGAGKSTLLKILSRVTAPTSGRIRVRGRVASLLEVGTGFHPELTGRENVYLNGAILGMSKAEVTRKFDEIVDFSGVEQFIETPVKRYSSGMYVRLAFAVAAHLEPEILVVDEVLAVGDAEFQKKCLGKMGEVAHAGRTVLFVSHNMAAVNQLCHRCLLLQSGQTVINGDAKKVISQYLQHDMLKKFDARSIASDEFMLFEVKIYQDGIQDHNLLITELPILVEYSYQVTKQLYGLRIGFDLVSKDGIVLFRTFDDDVAGQLTKLPGKYKANCIIPKSLLAPGNYYLYPRIGIHNVRWIYNSDSGIEIALHNQSGVNARYRDNRPGLIMPGLDWEIVKND